MVDVTVALPDSVAEVDTGDQAWTNEANTIIVSGSGYFDGRFLTSNVLRFYSTDNSVPGNAIITDIEIQTSDSFDYIGPGSTGTVYVQPNGGASRSISQHVSQTTSSFSGTPTWWSMTNQEGIDLFNGTDYFDVWIDNGDGSRGYLHWVKIGGTYTLPPAADAPLPVIF